MHKLVVAPVVGKINDFAYNGLVGGKLPGGVIALVIVQLVGIEKPLARELKRTRLKRLCFSSQIKKTPATVLHYHSRGRTLY
ncbi:hypothetical protein FACS1894133_7530 [Clostridia bacterium]|nr:hypothetical protein FACS1894133_7530 [Clostridia bacterium]